MEKRKETLSLLRLCRFCLSQDDTLTSLYDGAPTPKNSVHLAQKILSSISVEVFPSDKMPTFICGRCRMLMNICHEYKQICRQVDENIFQYIQNGTQMKKVQWPPILTKILAKCDLKSNIKPANSLLETVVEGGATVQVSPHELSDSEDDNENVINIKIEDSDNISKGNTCMNMINKNEQIKITRVKSEITKEFSSGTKLARHIRTHAGERPYPCKFCNKSFLKSHHYTRHVRLKHSEAEQNARVTAASGASGAGAAGGAAGDASEQDALRCEQCDESFATQDDLIYHSAIHATQNLICPLCQEKFDNVDEVTSHIKSHVSGEEFTCDFCELVFISNDKLEKHVAVAHEDEINEQEMALDESSMDIKVEDEDSESGIIVPQKNDNQARNEFIISNKDGDSDEKVTNTNSEESESEMTYTELATVDTLAIIKKESPVKSVQAQPKDAAAEAASKTEKLNKQTASILRRAEEIKRKTATPEIASVKVSNPISASDKSLRLLEKELQDLKRTNSRNDVSKTPGKTMETLRNKRVVTSTPKPRMEEKKSQVLLHRTPVEKKMPERRGVKENKEPRDAKDVKSNNGGVKEEVKEKEVKIIVKNGGGDKSMEEKVRRSSRQSKIKDYAKMSQGDDDEDDDSEDSDDEEYIETEKSDNRSKIRRATVGGRIGGGGPSPAAAPPAPLRKRGRPRKDQTKDVPNKVKKINEDGDEVEEPMDKAVEDIKIEEGVIPDIKIEREIKTPVNEDLSKRVSPEQKASPGSVLVSPSGQTLKKVPIKSLPPGVRPLPLPINARPINSGELCEMQIGKKLVKVQKIVMTKAEVEAMAKKGLVEMKDGTMVLKQGIKLPTTDPVAIKSTLVGDADVSKETAPKATVRADLEDE